MGVPYSIFCCFKSTTETRLIDLEAGGGGGGTYSTDVNTMLASANNAAIRSAIGVGTTDAPTFLGVNGPTGKGAINLSVGGAYAELLYNSVSMVQWTQNTVNLNSPNIRLGSNVNAFLAVDTVNIIEQRNGTSAQAFRVYNTYTDANNYERLQFSWSSNDAIIQTTKLGTGVARNLQITGQNELRLGVGAAWQWRVDASGNFETATDNLYDIGANGVNRPRNLYVATTAYAASFELTGGVFKKSDGTSFQLGGAGGAGRLAFDLGGGVTWNDSTNNPLILPTLGIMRSASGLAEINNGTLGTLRDLQLRSLFTTGNVGVGTTTPASGLHVSGALGGNVTTYDSAAAIKLTNTTGNSSWLLTSGIIGVINASFSIRQEGTSIPALTINNVGNVGIGVISTLAKVDTADTWNFSPVSITAASGNGTTATITVLSQSGIVAGSTIVVAGVTPAGFNGTFIATAATGTSITYANATTGAGTGGTIDRVFTSVKLNVTDTASNAASKLMDLQVGGVSQFTIGKTGGLRINNGQFSAGYGIGWSQSGFYSVAGNQIFVVAAGNAMAGFSSSGFQIDNQYSFGWGTIGTASTVILARDADGILAQRNGTAKQALRVYNTNLSGAPEWAEFDWITSGIGNTLRIGTNLSGNGAVRGIDFVVGGSRKGGFAINGYFDTSAISVGFISWTGGSGGARIYKGGTDGTFGFYNGTESVSTLLNIATAGYMKVRNIGDTAFNNIQGKLTTDTAYTATVVTPTGFLTLYDSTGTAYRVPCVV